MTVTRVTQSTLSAASIAGLQANLNRVQQLQDELSSGYRVARPSDAPSDAVAAMGYRADIRRTQQYQRNASDGLNFLGVTDSTLQSMLDSIRRARDLVVQGASGSLDAQGRSAIADEIDTIRQGLLSSANTQYLGRPIFGGTVAGGLAYDAASGAYLGDTGTITRTVASGTTVPVNQTGTVVFGPSGSSIFDVLAQISTDLRNPSGTANLTTDLSNLDGATSSVNAALAEVGARYNRLQSVQTNNDKTIATLQNGLSSSEEIDLPKTITELQLQQVAYQASLAATAKVIQPSLVDFLR